MDITGSPMDLSEFAGKTDRRCRFPSGRLKDVVNAVATLRRARSQEALDALGRAYKAWKDGEPNEFKARGEPIHEQMLVALRRAPGKYFLEMIPVIDPDAHPLWKPEIWLGTHLESKNCYAYACDDRTVHAPGSKQDPGDYFRAHHWYNETYDLEAAADPDENPTRRINRAVLRSAVDADNEVRKRKGKPFMKKCETKPVQNLPGHYLVALVVSATDYHWYRQDDNGYWSEKSGHDAPNNRGPDDKPIRDPSVYNKSRRPEYSDCYFYHVPKGGVPTASSGGVFLEKIRQQYAKPDDMMDPISAIAKRSASGLVFEQYTPDLAPARRPASHSLSERKTPEPD